MKNDEDQPQEDYPEWARPLNVCIAIILIVAVIFVLSR